MSIPLCRKCFLEALDPDGAYREIKELIEALPDDIRADEKEYRRRLDVCGRCEELNAGLCGKCGCYVEFRAAKKNMRCPHENDLWNTKNRSR